VAENDQALDVEIPENDVAGSVSPAAEPKVMASEIHFSESHADESHADESDADGSRGVLSAAPESDDRFAPQISSAPLAAVAVSELDTEVLSFCGGVLGGEWSGADLDAGSDADYLNFFAQVEGILPTTFFSSEDGKPFDPAGIDVAGQLVAIGRLLERSHDIRLLATRARLMILNRDLGGFAVSIGALAAWLERDWEGVHPRAEGGNLDLRRSAVNVLDMPTVVFPLQYAPLLEGRRSGAINYRNWMVASGDVKAREGEAVLSSSVITEAIAVADAAVLTRLRGHLKLLHEALQRIERAFAAHGSSVTLDHLADLAGRMRALIDPSVAATLESGEAAAAEGDAGFAQQGVSLGAAGPAPTSLALASAALAAIADYYSRAEPSSPTLPLVRQAHQLIGKSFLDVMTILVPTQVDKAAFQIGKDQVFDLPVSKLAGFSASAVAPLSVSLGDSSAAIETGMAGVAPVTYTITSRSQALALLDLVQRYFRHTEPSSPVPMLCERARALAELDFMSVLNDVLPKATLKAR
jgi:type VI secretion system protein ImpA